MRGAPGSPPAELYAPGTDADALTLVLCLHGAGSPAGRALDRLLPWADQRRLLLLAPKSVDTSWDVTRGGFGPDLANVDRLLEEVSARYPVERYVVSGFSDGASYALSLGVANGALFDSVVAWSPGFLVAGESAGRPRFFVSHGTGDDVLPVERTSRRLVHELREAGYEVTYVEFDGGHAAPAAVRARSIGWLTRTR